MQQQEIDEISEAFLDAWKEYFGQIMYYIPFNPTATQKHPVYGETKAKVYDEANKVMFHGTFKQEPIEEKGELAGGENYEVAEITFVTKELYDKGIVEIKPEDMVEVVFRGGKTKRYNIVAHYGKVQLSDNRIFTKLKVTDKNNE